MKKPTWLCELKPTGHNEEGIALLFAIMAMGALLGAGFISYLDGLSRDNTEQYNSLFFQGTLAAINNNIHTILTNPNALATSMAEDPIAFLPATCAWNSCSTGYLGSDISMNAGAIKYYLGSAAGTGNDGFRTSGLPCVYSGTFWTNTPLTNGAGICIVRPLVTWTAICVGGSPCSVAIPPSLPTQTPYLTGQITVSYANYQGGVVTGVPTNFGLPTNNSPPGLGYSPYTGLNDYPIVGGFPGVNPVSNLGWQYAGY